MSQFNFAFGHELIVDLFAGGGGASTGIEQAFGRPVDLAVNHAADSIAMHAANHPHTRHLISDVFEVDPLEATGGRQVGLLWASPDCKHFSKAKGGKPRSKKIRSLAWVVVKWAATVRPRVIMLENVEEFVTWGPLAPTGQPCPKRKGATFRRWVARLRALGYKVEWRELRACDYGAPTIRKRFFLVARCDGLPIRWPAPTHGKPGTAEVRKGKLQAWRTAADCIDWTRPCPSIFLTKDEARALGVKRPLAEATLRRIAKGVHRFVLDAAAPFIVNTRNGERAGQEPRVRSIGEPVWTVTAQGSQGAVVAPSLLHVTHQGERSGHEASEPMRTVTGANRGEIALASAFLTKYRPENAGAAADAPFPTITANGESERPGGNPPLAIVAAHLEQANGGYYDGGGRSLADPLSTVTGRGSQQQVVETTLAPAEVVAADRREQVRAFLIAYYGNEKDGRGCSDPMGTVVSRERFGLVTVAGEDYAIADIGLRMLTPRELYRAQGFPEDYVIDRGADGRPLPKDAQVRMCGNSVCPPLARALVEANVGEIKRAEEAQAA